MGRLLRTQKLLNILKGIVDSKLFSCTKLYDCPYSLCFLQSYDYANIIAIKPSK